MVNLKRTRDDILQAVISTVHKQGLVATSLSELLDKSGASSGSFYNYFHSKDELGHALIDFEWNLLLENILQPALKSSENPIDQVVDILNRLEAKNLEKPNCGGCLLGNFVVDLVEQDQSFRHHLTQIFDRWEQVIAETLGQATDQLQPDIDPDHLAEQILTVVEGTMLMGRLRHDPDRIRRGFASARQLIVLACSPKI
ncbi:MAG: TetR/AcrR family transcriptional regulator [Cyanobacteria bacterium P01_F01_bin.150]